MNVILITSALVFIFLIAFISDVRQIRHRKARLDEISMAPLPQLPLSFQWNWWGFALFMAIPAVGAAFFALIGIAVGATAFALPSLFIIIASGHYLYGYLRFALKGPSFVLDIDGIAFAGNYLPWREVSQIIYVPDGRTPFIRFRQTGSEAMGFSNFDQFYGKTSVSTYFISDPDGLVGWSRRLKEESQARGD